MLLRKWEALPEELQIPEVKKYYDILNKKRFSLLLKRLFDIVVSFFLLLFLSPLFVVIAFIIKVDSKGPVFYRQERVTKYGKKFRIFKFRSMVIGADRGSQLTVNDDERITRVGQFIRKYKIDELSQLIDVLRGTMTFVGTRPEVPEYVEKYTPDMMATLLLPAGITSQASVVYRNETKLLDASDEPEKTYLETVLPAKMIHNLDSIEKFSLLNDLKTMFLTVITVFTEEKAEEKSDTAESR